VKRAAAGRRRYTRAESAGGVGEHGGDGLAVAQSSGSGGADERAEGEEAGVDGFVGFGTGASGGEGLGEVDDHGLREESGRSVIEEEAAPAAGGVSRLFEEFAFCGGEGRLAGIDASGGKFPEVLAGGVAILALEQDLIALHGKDHDRTRVVDDVAASGDAVRFTDTLGGDGEDWSAIGGAVGDDLRFLHGLES